MGKTLKKAIIHSLSVAALAALSISLSLMPGFDLAKGIILAVSLSSLYLFRAVARTREEETDRYKRIAEEVFPVRLREDPGHLSTMLLSGDIPYPWLGWVDGELKVDIKKEAGGMLHALDSFCHFGDPIAQGIFRATCFVSACVAQGRNLEAALQEYVDKNRLSLGREFQKGCFLCNLEPGMVLPYGIFQATGAARLLVSFYQVERAVKAIDFFGRETRKIQAVKAFRICVKSSLEREEVKRVVNTRIPETDPKNFGSGRQVTGLFIQETISVNAEFIESRLPGLIQALNLE